MIKYIIIALIIILIYVIYIYRGYIIWFFNALKVTLKNNKGIKDLQKLGMNIRNVDNDSIIKYIEISKKILDKLGLKRNREFVLKKDLEMHLKYSRFSEKYVKELFIEILNYYNLNIKNIDLKINYVSSKYFLKYVGLYKDENEEQKRRKIILYIQNDMNIQTIISILAHECTHYLLMSNNIKIDNRQKNECLTDVTAVVAGFGKYMVDGYKISNRVVYDEVNKRSVKKNTVGYLSYKDIEYALKTIKRNEK